MLFRSAGLCHPGEIEPRHIVRRVSSNEVRLVANLYKFLKSGELLTNPKAHIVYEYYWPLATSRSFDPQPGDAHAGDAHVIAAREEPRMQLRREGVCRSGHNIPTAPAWLACASSDCTRRPSSA